MRLLREDQPDPDGSPSGEAFKSVFDNLGGLWVNAPDLVDQGSQSLKLLEAGDLSVLQGFPGADGQAQATEGMSRF